MDNKLRSWRRYRGLTIKDISERIALSPSRISSYERYSGRVTVPLLKKFGEIYQATPAQLLGSPSEHEVANFWPHLDQEQRQTLVLLAESLMKAREKTLNGKDKKPAAAGDFAKEK